MDEKNIRKYAQLMQELGLSALEISEDGSVVRLERNEQAKPAAPAPAAAPALAAEKKQSTQPEAAASDLINICSPMVGVFYCAPAENAPPFVQVGDTVKKGDVLCIIEAMKLMNEIVADQDGTIAEICVGNSQIVDFGHVLFRLRKDEA